MKNNNENNTMSIVGFILSFMMPVVGLILSILGLNKSKELNNKGKVLSIAGIIISVLLFIFQFLVLLLLISVGTVSSTLDTAKNKANKLMCEKAYDCELDSTGNYSCKYLNNDGIIEKITCENKNSDNDLIEEGYNKIDLTKNEQTYKILDKNIKNLETDIKQLNNYLTNDRGIITFNNNIFTFSNAQINFTLENVKTIKYSYIDCIGSLFVFVITNDNNVYYNHIADEMTTNQIKEFKKLTGKYSDVETLYLHPLTCGARYFNLLKDINENYYLATDESKFNEETFYIENDESDNLLQILTDRKIYFNQRESNKTFKFGLYENANETMKYIITTDNYLYDKSMNKYSESKIKYILSKKENDYSYIYKIIFEDNSKLEENNLYMK